jgi:alpha-L-rhamnosidase
MAAAVSARSQAPEVRNLKCEYLTDPLGIDVLSPRLSWEIAGTARDIRQLSYRLLVASSSRLLDADQGDLWDTGEVISAQSLNIQYNGKPLVSRGRCFWKVTITTNKGKSVWSNTAQWSMGLLSKSDWKGRWIGCD